MMLNDSDNTIKCKSVLQIVDTTRKLGMWGSAEVWESGLAQNVLSVEVWLHRQKEKQEDCS